MDKAKVTVNENVLGHLLAVTDPKKGVYVDDVLVNSFFKTEFTRVYTQCKRKQKPVNVVINCKPVTVNRRSKRRKPEKKVRQVTLTFRLSEVLALKLLYSYIGQGTPSGIILNEYIINPVYKALTQ